VGQSTRSVGAASGLDPDPRRRLATLHYATVAPLTRTIRGLDSEVVLEPDDGVPTRSAVTLDDIATIDQDLLVRYLATLSSDRMNEVWEAIHYALDLPF
jgi:mRNA interferase MazF